MISKGAKRNFETIKTACKANELALMNHTFTNCPSRGKRNPKTGALLCPKCWMEEYYYDQKVQREENKKK